MTNIHDLTAGQLHRIIAIKEQIEALQSELATIAGDGGEFPPPFPEDRPRKGRRSAAVRAKMAAAQKARWAKIRGDEDFKPTKKDKRRMSAAGRAAISAAAKARWARVKDTPATLKVAKKKDRRSSPAVRAKLAAAARTRWAKVRASGQTGL
jgi:hypothetical protein